MMRPLIVNAVLFISHFALGVTAEGLLRPEVSTWTEKQEDGEIRNLRKLKKPTAAPVPSTPPTNPSCHPSNFRALEDANRRWVKSGIISYRYVLDQVLSFFPSGPIAIEVTNCAVTSATFLMDGSDATTLRAPTIEQLFTELGQKLAVCPNDGPASYQVSFDPTLGYPVNANIDEDLAVADDVLKYSVPVRDFVEVTRSPRGCDGI